MKRLKNDLEKYPYNKAVRAAFMLVLKEAKAMLANIQQEELRYSLVREEKEITPHKRVVYEFVSPLLYLRLDVSKEDLFNIRYGFEVNNPNDEVNAYTANFLRAVYSLTSKEITTINIEACVSNAWCITECGALYEYVSDNNMSHKFELIKYRRAPSSRKMQAVA